MAAETAGAAEANKAGKPKSILIPIAAAAVVSAAVAGGATFFLASRHSSPAPAAEGEGAAAEHGDDKAEGKGEGKGKGSAVYLPLAPAFIANIGDADASHFLQVEIEVLVKSDAVGELVKLHSPQIRNAILMLMSQQKMAEMATREGKEALQKQVLEETQKILSKETGKPCVEAVYFTSFVMQ